MLALVAGQDVEPVEGSDGTDGRWRIARRVAPDRVISTVDPEARHAHKTRHRRQDGFKAHIAGRTRHRDHHRLRADHGQRAGVLRRRGRPRPAGRRTPTRSRCWPIPPTAPVRLLAALPRPGTPRSSNRGRCARRCRAGSPSTTSPSTRAAGTVDLPERGHPADHRHPASDLRCGLPGLPAAGPVHQPARGRTLSAPSPRRVAARAPGPRRDPDSRPSTASTGRWSNGPSPGCRPRQPAAPLPRNRSQRPLAAPPRRRRSTCAGCSPSG